MTVIGITGGTGSGKTTALNVLSDFGAYIVDCDELYHRMLLSDEDMIAEIAGAFPDAVCRGKVNREVLGSTVFSDSSALITLNRITHIYVKKAVEKLLAEQKRAGRSIFAIDAIALIESGLGDICNITVAVLADREIRARRIMARDSISYEYAKSRINAQKNDEYFRKNCDFILINDYSESGLFKEECIGFFHRILGGNVNEEEK